MKMSETRSRTQSSDEGVEPTSHAPVEKELSPSDLSKHLFADNQQALVTNRLITELSTLEANPVPYASAAPNLEKPHLWHCVIEGPPDSLYHDGIFFIDLSFPNEYPFEPPQITWKTRIYHCNMNSKGDVFHEKLNRSWICTMTVRNILIHLVDLLREARPHDVRQAGVNPICELYEKNRSEYDEKAREWTKRYAC